MKRRGGERENVLEKKMRVGDSKERKIDRSNKKEEEEGFERRKSE